MTTHDTWHSNLPVYVHAQNWHSIWPLRNGCYARRDAQWRNRTRSIFNHTLAPFHNDSGGVWSHDCACVLWI